MADETTYEQAGADAAESAPIKCGDLKKGSFVVIKDRPCKVVEYTTSKTGKHGHAKAHIIALDIFTDKKLEELCPTSHNMMVPVVTRTEYALIDIGDEHAGGFVSLQAMKPGDKDREDLKLPENEKTAAKIKEAFETSECGDVIVIVQKAMGEEGIIDFKIARAG